MRRGKLLLGTGQAWVGRGMVRNLARRPHQNTLVPPVVGRPLYVTTGIMLIVLAIFISIYCAFQGPQTGREADVVQTGNLHFSF